MTPESAQNDTRLCLCCGQPFHARRSNQKYCSEGCRRKYLRHHESEHPVEPGCPVLRVFHCRHCGAPVEIRSVRDCRRVFCCSHCERLYWKHRHAEPREEDSHAGSAVL